jgi:pyruvate/2-oxoglutarate dehydrogenase complex dihydrolipoamide acyltransferase (E2) component
LGDQHPDFNHGPWTQDETAKLKEFVAEHGDEQVDWEAMADKLGVRLLYNWQKIDDLHVIDKPNASGLHETQHDAKDSCLVPRF